MSHILVKCRFSDLSMTRVVDIAYSLSLSYHRAISLSHSAPAPLMRSRASLGVSFSEGSLVPVGAIPRAGRDLARLRFEVSFPQRTLVSQGALAHRPGVVTGVVCRSLQRDLARQTCPCMSPLEPLVTARSRAPDVPLPVYLGTRSRASDARFLLESLDLSERDLARQT